MTGDPHPAAADVEALRHGAGAVWLARDVLLVAGPDAPSYLQGQCSQDVLALAEGASADTLVLEPDGKLCALVRVTRTGPEAYVVDLDAGFAEAVVARLVRFRLRAKVTIEPLDWRCLALRGDPADFPATDPALLAPAVEWHGWRGVDLLGPDPGAGLDGPLRWCAPAAYEACRIESGVPVMGRELDGRTIAAEADLVERTVSFTKGCFTGQELVARLDARGAKVARHLRAVVAEDPGTTPAALTGASLWRPAAERALGAVTSAAWSLAFQRAVGLAYVHRSVEPPAPLSYGPPDGAPDGSTAGRVGVRAIPLV